MNLWNKIVLGSKFLICGFESATDYLFKLLNDFLGKDNVSMKIQKYREFVVTILKYLKKYEKYCPAIWANDYLKVLSVIQIFVDMFEDGKVSFDEIQSASTAVQDAIDEWMK